MFDVHVKCSGARAGYRTKAPVAADSVRFHIIFSMWELFRTKRNRKCQPHGVAIIIKRVG